MPLARLRLSFETCPRMKLVPSLAAVTRSAADPADFLPASIAVPFESDGARLLEVFSIG
jgi:hypothetical protein